MAIKIDEYVPIAVPIVSARMKKKIDSLPKNNTDSSANRVDTEVLIDLAHVCLRDSLALSFSDLFAWWIRFSLSLSSTTMVSFTE